MTNRRIDSILDITDRYELFLFDQFGVLHDGVTAYPGMVESLTALKAAGKKIAVISNSGKRADYNQERIAQFGYGADLIETVMTSGEVAWCELVKRYKDRSTEGTSQLEQVMLISRGEDNSAIAGLPYTLTEDAECADLVLITGSQGEQVSLQEYQALLEPAAMRSIPAICTNPDKVMMLGQGNLFFGAGRIAETYIEMGGDVSWIGKPYPDIYAATLLAADSTPANTVCIGDSVEHDIAGATSAGCASVLVSTGIHSGISVAEREILYEKYRVVPDYVLRS